MTHTITVTLRQESSDAYLNRDVLAVCRDVIRTCSNTIGTTPPLGPKPYIVQQAPDGMPRACLNGLPDEYIINVTCLHTRLYAKLSFQLAHEIGHFYVDPYRSNWFIESVCTAIAFICLSAMAERWLTAPPFDNWKLDADKFSDYRRQTINDALVKVGVSSALAIPSWVATSLREVVARHEFDRPHEMLCASVIADIMGKHPHAVSAVTRLGAATPLDCKTDFAAWAHIVPPEESGLVEELRLSFVQVFQDGH